MGSHGICGGEISVECSRELEGGREQVAGRREDSPIFMYAVGSVWVRGLVTGAKAGPVATLPTPHPPSPSTRVQIRPLDGIGQLHKK